MEKLNFSWPKIGNEKAISFLDKVAANRDLASTYIFVGPEDLGKSTLALAFARNLQISSGAIKSDSEESFNSDLYILQTEEEKKTISIEAVREFIRSLNLSSFAGGFKIGLIKEAELLSEEAKSALLKTLEEPRDGVVIVLLVKDLDSLPATIVSRAQIIRFQPVDTSTIYDYLLENHGASRSLAKDLAHLSLGRPLSAIRFLENPENYKEYLRKAELWLKNNLNTNVNERLKILDELFKDKTWSKEAVLGANNILDMAESIERDILLVSFAQKEIIRHNALREKMENIVSDKSPEVSQKDALKHLKFISEARKYLAANVNPRLTLEQILINY